MDTLTPAERLARLGPARRPAPPSETERLRSALARLSPEGRREHLTGLSEGGWLEPPGPDWAAQIPGQVLVAVLRDGSVLSQGPADAHGLRDVRVHRSPSVFEVVAPPGPSAPGEEFVGPAEEPYGPALLP